MSGTNGFKVIDRPAGRGTGGKFSHLFSAIVEASKEGRAICVERGDAVQQNRMHVALNRLGSLAVPPMRVRKKRVEDGVALWAENK